MTGLKTSVQLLRGNKLWFNRKIVKGQLKCPTMPAHFLKCYSFIFFNNKLRKIENIQSNPNATFKVIDVFLSKMH